MSEIGDFTVDESEIRWDMYATRDEILSAMENPSVGICDVRPPDYFNGSKAKTIRGGHLMTAENIPFYSFWEDKAKTKLKSKEEIKEIVAAKFPKQVRKIITTCNTGHKASAGFLIWQLGYDWALDDVKIINLFEISQKVAQTS
ncbi:hypothetical protein DRP07_02715 [Archaeoglobales archaeon]|nr:MAG: hypothetical protein DRP07_02715 [Archaeoglobales archaeon]